MSIHVHYIHIRLIYVVYSCEPPAEAHQATACRSLSVLDVGVCTCVRVHVRECTHKHTYAYTRTSRSERGWIYIYVYSYICMYSRVGEYIYIYVSHTDLNFRIQIDFTGSI